MHPIKSTAEILALKTLNKTVDQKWIDWSIKMLEAGFYSENLLFLAGENENTNQFELQQITDKALAELKLDYSNKELIVKNYACFVVNEVLTGNRKVEVILDMLERLCIELGYPQYLFEFYELSQAYRDIAIYGDQHILPNATNENIEQIVIDYFKNFSNNCEATIA
ncbi:hypothetical protein [Flavobacterium silvaticum]|uniref:Uncharacterized protein n=1 Tax=Flavobacterium silvaticum TaxID=1852020 RepID=A0A972JGV9_9FLAO|nr:hypothetical protein [Flavobacterium silvaticum]NMH26473.1 hypothetical protein [Flavobacterium silvaticum]